TPAIVPNAFALEALIEGYEIFEDKAYLAAAKEIGECITSGLNRTIETDDELCFSYTPVDHQVIFNASLLAGECLARLGSIAGNDEYLAMAAKTARFVVRCQSQKGSWAYGEGSRQKWVDN